MFRTNQYFEKKNNYFTLNNIQMKYDECFRQSKLSNIISSLPHFFGNYIFLCLMKHGFVLTPGNLAEQIIVGSFIPLSCDQLELAVLF